MGCNGIYSSTVLFIIQDRKSCKINLEFTLREENIMAISVAVPKDLSGIKTKVALNLTKRQIICFSGAIITATPTYFLTRNMLGTSGSTFLLMLVAMPFFFFAMYSRDGFPAEKILMFMIRQKFLTPGIRPYKSQNLYARLEDKERLRKEVHYLEEKARGGRKEEIS